jgi:hypothetical protein
MCIMHYVCVFVSVCVCVCVCVCVASFRMAECKIIRCKHAGVTKECTVVYVICAFVWFYK